MAKEFQLGLGGDFAYLNTNNAPRISSGKLIGDIIPETEHIFPKEQLVFNEEKFRKEIPNLRLVKKGEKVYVPTLDGHLRHRATLEKDALLRAVKLPRGNRFEYFNRLPMLVSKYGHTWTIPAEKSVYAYSKQTRIPEKMIPQVIQMLKQPAGLA
jgi:hypothetical protein